MWVPRCARVGYVGSLYRDRGLEELLDACTRIPRQLDVSIEIVGPASDEYRTWIASTIEEKGIEHLVSVHPALPPAQVVEFLSELDAALVLYGEGDNANDSLPNKLFDAMSAGTCVIANQAQAADLIREAVCGVAVSLDPSDLAGAIGWGSRESKRSSSTRVEWSGSNSGEVQLDEIRFDHWRHTSRRH